MKYMLALTFALMLMLSASYAQGADLRLCGETEWETLRELEDEYYPLINRVFSLSSLDSLTRFAARHVGWRAELLPRLPDCREAREIGILMAQMVGDAVVSAAMERFLGLPPADNPLTPAVTSGSERLYLLFLLEPDTQKPATEAPADEDILCSLMETGAHYDLTAGYNDLLEAAGNVATMEDLVGLSAVQVAWRARLWRQLPACADVFDTVYLLSYATSDLVALVALNGIGVDPESNPYFGAFSSSQAALQDFFNERTMRSRDEDIAPLDVSLPPCGRDVLENMGSGKQTYMDLVFQMNEGVYSNEELTAYAEAMLAWRDDHLPIVPPCKEAVAVALLESWLTGDFIADTVAMWIGVPAQDNFFAEDRGANNVRLTALVMDLRSAGDSAAPASTPESLPACDDAQLDEVFGNMLKTMRSLSKNAALIDDVSSFLSYGHYQAFWRLNTWHRLPVCSEAFAMAMLMNEFASDALSYHALRTVNVNDEDNPFWDTLGQQLERFEELAAASGRDFTVGS